MLLAGEGLPLDAVREQLHAAVDLVVEVSRGSGGSRAVTAVGELAARPDTGERLRKLADGHGVLAPAEREGR